MMVEWDTDISSVENEIEDARRAIDIEREPDSADFYREFCTFTREYGASNMRKHGCIIKKSLRIAKNLFMPYTSPRIFDLFVLVVDNYGDIGMVAEFILATELVYPRFFIFRVWTDSPQSVRSFFENNHLEHISIEKIDQFDSLHSGRYIGLFFHAPIPKLPSRKTLIFRFDHISFDLGWISGHGLPHITSNSLHQIEEFIPSFLPE